jgi:hypothetical protein
MFVRYVIIKKIRTKEKSVSYKDFSSHYLVAAFDVMKEIDENLFSKTKSSKLEGH